VLQNADHVIAAMLATPRASWERLKYPVYPKHWHARAWRFAGYAGLILVPIAIFGTEWLIVLTLRAFKFIPYRGGAREIGRLIIAAITFASLMAGAAALLWGKEQAEHVDIALKKTRKDRFKLAIDARARATKPRTATNPSLRWAAILASAVAFFGVWILAWQSAGWPIGLALGWVPAAFASATAYAIVRRLWWLVLLGAALISLWLVGH
jgi:hypothetical protein